tara:strand:- start:4024 stop:4203 length:180 start_codon:yes stop_codon:yes gene_type:complete
MKVIVGSYLLLLVEESDLEKADQPDVDKESDKQKQRGEGHPTATPRGCSSLPWLFFFSR